MQTWRASGHAPDSAQAVIDEQCFGKHGGRRRPRLRPPAGGGRKDVMSKVRVKAVAKATQNCCAAADSMSEAPTTY
jgi:hypothetical protein